MVDRINLIHAKIDFELIVYLLFYVLEAAFSGVVNVELPVISDAPQVVVLAWVDVENTIGCQDV